MWLLTKELAQAVVKTGWRLAGDHFYKCPHCRKCAYRHPDYIEHTTECIVTRAKLLLSVEYGVKS